MAKCFQCGGEHQGTFSCMPPEPPRQVLTNPNSRRLIAMAEALEKRGGGWQAEVDNLRKAAAEIERLEALLMHHTVTPEPLPSEPSSVASFPEEKRDVVDIRAMAGVEWGDYLAGVLAHRCYTMSEPHLSGYRLVLGFVSLPDVQAAHEALTNLSPASKSPEPLQQRVDIIPLEKLWERSPKSGEPRNEAASWDWRCPHCGGTSAQHSQAVQLGRCPQKSEAVALAHSTDVRQEIKGKGDVPDSQFASILKAAESGDAVNTMDLINALWWRVRNQKREIARLHTRNKAASCPTDFNGDPIKPKGL